MTQIQDLKTEMKGMVGQIVAKKECRNALKLAKKELTSKIKATKKRIKELKKAKEDASVVREELNVLKGQKIGKTAEILTVKIAIVDLRKLKVALRNKIKSIKSKD